MNNNEKFYEFINGHPILYKEESEIIVDARFDDKFMWMNDCQIKKLIKVRVDNMYKGKFPNAKKWYLRMFNFIKK